MSRWRLAAAAGSVLAIVAGGTGLAVWQHNKPPGDVVPASISVVTHPTTAGPTPSPPSTAGRGAGSRSGGQLRTRSIRLSTLPSGGGHEPSALTVPAEAISGPVSAVGTDPKTGLLRVPDTTTRIVWWAYGASPGDRHGSVVLAAHVDYNGREGLFFNLDRTPIGALVHLREKGGATVTYKVDGREHVDKTQLHKLGLFTRQGSPRLVLITCGGAFDAATHHYQDNIVVTAHPV